LLLTRLVEFWAFRSPNRRSSKPGRDYVILDLPREKPTPILLKREMSSPLGDEIKGIVSFPIGIGVEGKPVIADFSDPNTCHALVAGSTGSGKSEWLQSLLAGLALRNSRTMSVWP
jgi:S-DNA-T family DNA segregation ATPase FtsK/SpoIIIE